MNHRATAAINQALDHVEADDDVAILLAVESASRAWGFPSSDSDYDVRFVYVRPPDWYLSIDLEARRDVIEYPLKDNIDLSGWDLRKALRLFRKSNPPLLEWLQCPIVYRERCSFAAPTARNVARLLLRRSELLPLSPYGSRQRPGVPQP